MKCDSLDVWGEEGGEVEDELQAEAWETRWVTRKVIAWMVTVGLGLQSQEKLRIKGPSEVEQRT